MLILKNPQLELKNMLNDPYWCDNCLKVMPFQHQIVLANTERGQVLGRHCPICDKPKPSKFIPYPNDEIKRKFYGR
jgi:hypothetical protein